MDDTIDLLQIKIEKAKAALSEDTLRAIDAVPWQAAILKMRETKGYSFEQLGDLELETELLLCGLLTPQDYPKELENRMKISKAAVNELVDEMNKEVFSKIKEELVKITERKTIFENKTPPSPKITPPTDTKKESKNDAQMPGEHAAQTTSKPDLTIPELEAGDKQEEPAKVQGTEIRPVSEQKLSGSFKIPSTKTEHTLENITKTSIPVPPSVKTNKPYMDPYREIPE